MQLRNSPLLPVRAAMILMAGWVAASVTPLAGQQAADSSGVPPSSAPVSPARATSPSATVLGPRITPRFQRVEPRLAPSRVSERSSLAVAGGQHVIVVSTLVLVLATILIVLLVVN